MQKKGAMGFHTSSMRIQEEYETLLAQIQETKVSWAETLKAMWNSHEKERVETANFFKALPKIPSHEKNMEMEHRVLSNGHSLLVALIARIGMGLAVCNERIANLDKELKDLRRAVTK